MTNQRPCRIIQISESRISLRFAHKGLPWGIDVFPADLEQRMSGASTSERVKLSKQLATLQAQAEEIRSYEEKIHHLADQMIKIDLDDGVKHNYEIFKDVLAKIK